MPYQGPPFGWRPPKGAEYDRLSTCASCGAEVARWHGAEPTDADGSAHRCSAKPKPVVASPSRFDGSTVVAVREGEEDSDDGRLSRQLDAVRRVMADGGWHRLAELAGASGGSEAAVSARLRDLRKPRFGGHTIERRYVARGLHEYRMLGIRKEGT